MSIGLLTKIIVKGYENFSHLGGMISKITGTKKSLGGGCGFSREVDESRKGSGAAGIINPAR